MRNDTVELLLSAAGVRRLCVSHCRIVCTLLLIETSLCLSPSCRKFPSVTEIVSAISAAVDSHAAKLASRTVEEHRKQLADHLLRSGDAHGDGEGLDPIHSR